MLARVSSQYPAPDVSEIEKKYRRSKRWNVILGALSALLLVVVVAQLAPGTGLSTAAPADIPSPEAPAATTETIAPGDVATGEPTELAFVRRDPADAMAIGEADAPIVLSLWTDYRCPYCARFSNTTMPQLVEEYVNTGKVRIEVHDVAFFGEESAAAAVAARAAGAQGLFFEYVHALYAAAPESGHPELPREQLIGFAEQVGVPDLAAFEAGLDDADLWAAVDASTQVAQQWGVDSVPFFVVHDQSMAGAQPIDSFRQFLDDRIAAVS